MRPRDVEASRRELVDAGGPAAAPRRRRRRRDPGRQPRRGRRGASRPHPDLQGNPAAHLRDRRHNVARRPRPGADRALRGAGLRTIEVQRASLSDLDLEAGELLRGKRRDRRVHLRANVVALLRAWLMLRPDAPPDQPLFVGFGSTCRGLRLSRHGIRGALVRAFAAAGLVLAALSQPRRDGSRRPLRRAALGLAVRRAAGGRVPSAHMG
ncbi:MAG: hypothetical protein ACLPYS_13320 [Vulcanimicrobiaceae bacterium]